MNTPIIAWLGNGQGHHYQVHEDGFVLHVVLIPGRNKDALLNNITLQQMEHVDFDAVGSLQNRWYWQNVHGDPLQIIDEDVFNTAFEEACRRLGILPITNYQKKA